MRSLVRILPGPNISARNLLICFFVTDFVRKSINGKNFHNPCQSVQTAQANKGQIFYSNLKFSFMFIRKSFLTDDNTRSFCGHCGLDCIEHAV